MRVSIIYLTANKGAALDAVAKAMAKAIEGQGHEVELLGNAKGQLQRLTISDYVIIGVEPVGIRGKLPPRVAEILAQAGSLAAKRSMAFVLKRGPFRNKTLPRLMKAMEAQGMNVNYAEVVSGPAEAAIAAKEAPIERS
ncbi:MAG: hypothetical protein WCL50_07840 [Spirochaetota bacterium]